MSRTYKQRIYKESSKFSKRKANKAVRRQTELSDGSFYKKCYNSWLISDFGWDGRWDMSLDWNVDKAFFHNDRWYKWC